MFQCVFLFACFVTSEASATFTSYGNGPRSPRNLKDSTDPEMTMTTVEIIQYFGYPTEIHTITTKDGYILETHRIPFGRKATEGPRTPVILQHGFLCSSADFVLNFPYQSIGFILADAGYDVWLTNIRGNTYGRVHTIYNPDIDKAFWRFSWDQMGAFDVPAITDYILNVTRYSQLYYAGHSMGSTMALAMLSTKTEYNDKIKTFLAIAPVATLNYASSPVTYLASYAEKFTLLKELLTGTAELFPSKALIHLIAKYCDGSLKILCKTAVFILAGYNKNEMNSTRMDVYIHHTPAGTSGWTMTHYAQIILHGQFRMCDWGPVDNMVLYGQITPPIYNLSKVTTPTIIFWANNDYLADPKDVSLLANSLPNLKGSYRIGDAYWAHLDFLWGINAGIVFLPQLIENMPRF